MPSVVRRCIEGFGNAKDACLPLARGRLPRGELEWCWGRKEPGGLKSGRPGEPQHRAGCVTYLHSGLGEGRNCSCIDPHQALYGISFNPHNSSDSCNGQVLLCFY